MIGQKRLIAKIILILFCLSHFFAFIERSDADCEKFKKDMDYWERRIIELSENLTNLKNEGYMANMAEGAGEGMISGAAGGAVGGAAAGAAAGGIGAIPGAAQGFLLGGLAGFVTGGIVGALAYRAALEEAQGALDNAERHYAVAYANYQMHKHEDSGSGDICTICYGSGACHICQND